MYRVHVHCTSLEPVMDDSKEVEDSNKRVVLKSESGVLALPGNRKRKPIVKTVLEEDEFTEAMTKIIRRDFFPEVPKLQAQLAYLESTEIHDPQKLREISERFASNDTPSSAQAPASTPSTFETPLHDADSSGHSEGIVKEQPAKNPGDAKSLDAFFSKYQSEDDASFIEIMEKTQQKHREKYSWMYDKEDTVTPALESSQQPLAIEDSTENKAIATWNYTARNTLMYIPHGVEDSFDEKLAKNQKKVILHTNTRLPREFLQHQLMKAKGEAHSQSDTVQAARERIGIDGKQVLAQESPKVNGYGFLATPNIHPGVEASPLMTWGSIDSTPMRLDNDITGTPGPVFKIPKQPIREQLGRKLADNVTKAQRDKKKVAIAQASSSLRQSIGNSPSTTSQRLQSLSPAARKLINRASPSRHIIGGSDKALRASYTPSHSQSTTPIHSPLTHTTPKHKQPGNQTPSLTDNLLNLKHP